MSPAFQFAITLSSVTALCAAAATMLKHYVDTERLVWLGASLMTYAAGTYLYSFLIKAQGLAVATAISSSGQIVLGVVIAAIVFQEKLSANQVGAVALSLAAIWLITKPNAP